jgi:anion-transporting  ArsA/GET3 family ATPase
VSNVLEGLLKRRLLLVTGTGGTGKTTLAAAIAKLSSGRGLRTVVVEVAGATAVPPLLSDDVASVPKGDDRNPVPLGPDLYTFRVDPLEALREYLELQLRFRPVVTIVTRNPGFRRMLDAAPGWRELITLGKLWHLETRRDADRPRWDLIVVDAPATGQGLAFLSVPRVVIETVRMGPLRRHTDWVQALLTDPKRTLVVPVTLAEELPVRETLELCTSVRQLGLAIGPILANAVEPQPDLADAEQVARWLGRLPNREGPCGLSPAVLQECLDHASRRGAMQQFFLGELREHEKGQVVQIPARPGGVDSPTHVSEIAEALEAALTGQGPLP